nr:hypothetical protein BaRGS_016282 [Batillaria attramentaria]
MPEGAVVSYEKDPIGKAAEHVYEIVGRQQDDVFTRSVKQAVSVIEEALDKYTRYNLELIRYEGRIKENLAALKQGHPGVKAVLMGTRKTDPYSDHLESFSMTDPDWPQFMRFIDHNGIVSYKPAYELVENGNERDGRNT